MTRTYIRFEKRSRTFNLSATSIDRASEWLDESLQAANADKPDRLRMRLLFEEALINLAEHFGKDHEGTAYLEKRHGRVCLRLVVSGDKFNPLKPTGDDDQGDWSMSLFSIIDMQVHYAYALGANVLRMSLPRPSRNPVFKIALALLVGSAFGLLGNFFIPNATQEAFSGAILYPIASMWVRLLQTISGPIIFLTALTASFATKRVADYGGSRFSVLARYFAISGLVVIFALVFSWPFFPIDVSPAQVSGFTLSTMLDQVLQIVPNNLFEPFITANTPQLLLIAIATGYLLAVMESQIKELNAIIQQLYMFGLAAAKYACQLVPLFVGIILCLKLWTHDTAMLEGIWLPLALSIALSTAVLLAALLIMCMRMRVSPLLVAKKLKGPFMAALKNGTLDFSAINDLAGFCKRALGIDSEFARAVLPQGLFLYMPTSAIGICVFILFAAHMEQLSVDQMWIIAAAVLSVVLAVATPPLTGANLLSFIVAFSYLGISDKALLAVMVFDIVFGVICIAFDQAMLQIENVNYAERMSFLNVATLRAPLPEDAP